mgnify:CR=1 FL=1
MTEVAVRLADLSDQSDGEAIVELLNGYAIDPMGQGAPFSEEHRRRLVPELQKQPHALALLAFIEGEPAGLAICILGFSTFRLKPVLNIHDFCVAERFQGRGVGKRLMAGVEEEARRRGCCKITLEVREDNLRAQALYLKCGFDPGKRGGDAMLFWGKSL